MEDVAGEWVGLCVGGRVGDFGGREGGRLVGAWFGGCVSGLVGERGEVG